MMRCLNSIVWVQSRRITESSNCMNYTEHGHYGLCPDSQVTAGVVYKLIILDL